MVGLQLGAGLSSPDGVCDRRGLGRAAPAVCSPTSHLPSLRNKKQKDPNFPLFLSDSAERHASHGGKQHWKRISFIAVNFPARVWARAPGARRRRGLASGGKGTALAGPSPPQAPREGAAGRRNRASARGATTRLFRGIFTSPTRGGRGRQREEAAGEGAGGGGGGGAGRRPRVRLHAVCASPAGTAVPPAPPARGRARAVLVCPQAAGPAFADLPAIFHRSSSTPTPKETFL